MAGSIVGTGNTADYKNFPPCGVYILVLFKNYKNNILSNKIVYQTFTFWKGP